MAPFAFSLCPFPLAPFLGRDLPSLERGQHLELQEARLGVLRVQGLVGPVVEGHGVAERVAELRGVVRGVEGDDAQEPGQRRREQNSSTAAIHALTSHLIPASDASTLI